jgi:hypothetical protein
VTSSSTCSPVLSSSIVTIVSAIESAFFGLADKPPAIDLGEAFRSERLCAGAGGLTDDRSWRGSTSLQVDDGEHERA